MNLGLNDAPALVELREASREETNQLLVEWEHPLGVCNRPFGQQGWVLTVEQRPVALAVSASIVSSTVRAADGGTFHRGECVELARIARAPDEPLMLRVCLRLWRVACAERWPYWRVRCLVSYAMPGTPGDIYRFDGWENAGRRRASGAGGTWTNRSRVAKIADGVKTLWLLPLAVADSQNAADGLHSR